MRRSPNEVLLLLQQAIQRKQLEAVGTNAVRFTDSTPSSIRTLLERNADKVAPDTYGVATGVIQ